MVVLPEIMQVEKNSIGVAELNGGVTDSCCTRRGSPSMTFQSICHFYYTKHEYDDKALAKGDGSARGGGEGKPDI
jgi:hypothetical protein